jgi:hypothetical protein
MIESDVNANVEIVRRAKLAYNGCVRAYTPITCVIAGELLLMVDIKPRDQLINSTNGEVVIINSVDHSTGMMNIQVPRTNISYDASYLSTQWLVWSIR